jgi:S-adenosylmethionine decarboxylase
MKKNFHSVHLLVEFWDCKPEILNNHDLLVNSLKKAAVRSNATILDISSHQFSPQGVTAIALLAESHLSIHTWPEFGYAAIDIFTCGENMNPHKTVEVLEELLKPGITDVEEVSRGIKKI